MLWPAGWVCVRFFLFFFWIIFCVLFFFFFQAEDGIRDWSVTGVQTCALPILRLPRTLRKNPFPFHCSSQAPKNNAKEFALLLGSLGVNLGNKLVISLQLLC